MYTIVNEPESPPIAGTIVRTKIVCHNFRLLVQTRRTIKDCAWEFPGGSVKDNEFIEDAVTRELREETGINGIELIPIIDCDRPTPHGGRYKFIYYTATLESRLEPVPEDTTEILRAEWFHVRRLPKLTEEVAYVNQLFHNLLLS